MSRPTSMKVDGTVYWTIMTYDEDGVLVDADATPVVDIRKNGSAILDVASSSKRSGQTGIYDYTYNPSGEAEGDCFLIQETATISSQSYVNSWSLEVEAVERGTDGANTIAPVDVSSNVSAILADTNELQQNQGDWLTATGFNTVAPDNASITAILADTNELQGNQGDWATATTTVASNMRGTDNALLAATAPTNWAAMEINVDGEITTSNPASGGGSAHTAADVRDLILAGDKTPITMASNKVSNVVLVDTTTNLTNGGSGGDDAATIYAYFTAGSNEDVFKADVSALALETTVDSVGTTVTDTNVRVQSVPQDTYTQFTSGSNEDAFKADVSALATSANLESVALVTLATNTAVNALNDFDPAVDVVAHVTLVDTTTDVTNQSATGPTAQEIVDAWGNQPQGVYTTPDTFGFYLDAQVSTAGSGGTGLYQATVRVQDTSNNALQGARVNVDGTTLTLTTDSSGEVTFNLDSGVYLLEVSPPANYDTPVGQVLTITSGDPSDTTFTLTQTTDPTGCTPPWIG